MINANMTSETYRYGIIVNIPEEFKLEDFFSIREKTVGIEIEDVDGTFTVDEFCMVFNRLLEEGCVYGHDNDSEPEVVLGLIYLLKKLDLVVYEFFPTEEYIIISTSDRMKNKIHDIDKNWTRIKNE